MTLHRQWLALAAAAILMAVTLQAQPKGRGMSRMMYDTSTEMTFKGTVEEVTQGTRGMMGTHLTVKTDKGNMQVMLGPSNFISSKGFSFAKGDEVEVTGSKVTMGGAESLIAREVVKGGQTLTLRDKSGKPEWSGMMRGTKKP
jgi:hypothetical protein